MKLIQTNIEGVILIEPVVHGDARGFFLETYHAEHYHAGGINGPFVQDNHRHQNPTTESIFLSPSAIP